MTVVNKKLSIERLVLERRHYSNEILNEIAVTYGSDLSGLSKKAKNFYRSRCFLNGKRPPNKAWWPAYEAIMGDDAKPKPEK